MDQSNLLESFREQFRKSAEDVRAKMLEVVKDISAPAEDLAFLGKSGEIFLAPPVSEALALLKIEEDFLDPVVNLAGAKQNTKAGNVVYQALVAAQNNDPVYGEALKSLGDKDLIVERHTPKASFIETLGSVRSKIFKHCRSQGFFQEDREQFKSLVSWLVSDAVQSACEKAKAITERDLPESIFNLALLDAVHLENEDAIVDLLGDDVSRVALVLPHFRILHEAVATESVSCLKALLAKGFDITVTDGGRTVLHAAVSDCKSNVAEIVELLLKSGADAEALFEGKTAFDIAKLRKGDKRIDVDTLEILEFWSKKKEGAALCAHALALLEGRELRSSERLMPSHALIMKFIQRVDSLYEDLLKSLSSSLPLTGEKLDEFKNKLARTDNVTVKAALIKIGRSPDFFAGLLPRVAQSGEKHAMLTLLDCGFKIDSVDAQGYTALDWAAMEGDNTFVSFLLEECGADFRRPDRDDYTPLFLAARMERPDNMITLRKKGAEWNPQNNGTGKPQPSIVRIVGDQPKVLRLIKSWMDKEDGERIELFKTALAKIDPDTTLKLLGVPPRAVPEPRC